MNRNAPAWAEILLETTLGRNIFVILLDKVPNCSVLVLKSSMAAAKIHTTP